MHKSRAAVEVELLSSTSREATEVWEGNEGEDIGKVVRLQERRQITTILYDDVYKNVYDFKTATEEKLLERVGDFHEPGLEDLPPNLVLNVGGQVLGRVEAAVSAAIAILAQAVVLMIDALFTYHLDLVTVGSQHYGFPVTCAGTMAFSLGFFCCVHVVQTATKQVRYVTTEKGKSLKLLWLQKGLGKWGNCEFGTAIERQHRPQDNRFRQPNSG